MELLIRLFITIVIVGSGAKVLHWTWTSQIDPIATFQKLINKGPKIADIVVTRNPKKLYQGGEPVADITGQINLTDRGINFEQLANTSELDTKKTIEYQRDTYRIIQIGNIIGMKSVASNTGAKVLQSVMENVVCEKIN